MKDLTEYITESRTGHIYNMFTILKPGFTSKLPDFVQRLTENGWAIIKFKNIKITPEDAGKLYLPHKDKPFYNDLCKYMSEGDSSIFCVYKDVKDPVRNMDALKDKIRKEWGKDEMRNAMHSSDSPENVRREAALFF